MPRFSRAQIARRRRIAAAILAAALVLVLGACSILVTRALTTAFTMPEVHEANNAAATVAATPADARSRTQLLGETELAEGEAMGIDVSVHQGTIDWRGVAADGYSFAYIKATEGANYTDPQFEANWKGAQAEGVTVGAYHYFTLCSPGAAQARDFLAAVPVGDTHLPPALDLEFDGACDERPEASRAQAEIDDFLRIVEAEWGRRAVIYSSREWREHYGLPAADGRPDWLFSDSGRPESEDWSVWQFRFDGEVTGIEGPVDIDVVRIEELRSHATLSEADREELARALKDSGL